jgi:hypothetical protein
MIPREIIHLALAGYQGEEQTERLAKRIQRTTTSPKVKRAMKTVLNFPLSKAELARRVYWEEMSNEKMPNM